MMKGNERIRRFFNALENPGESHGLTAEDQANLKAARRMKEADFSASSSLRRKLGHRLAAKAPRVYQRHERRARMLGYVHSTWKTAASLGVGAAIILILAWAFNNARMPGIDISTTPTVNPALSGDGSPTPVATLAPDPTQTLTPTTDLTTPTPTWTFEEEFLASEEKMRELVLAQEPLILESELSPDGVWLAEVQRYECLPTGENQERAVERIFLRRSDGQAEQMLEEQFTYCGGKGAVGLGNIVWTADSRFLYYTTAKESFPGGYGICLWQRPLTRLEVLTGERLELSYGVTSPEGERWVIMEGEELVIWNYDAGEVGRFSSPQVDSVFMQADWLPDGRSLVYLVGSNNCMPFGPMSLGMVDLVSGQHTWLVDEAVYLEFSLTPDGRGIFYKTAESEGAETRYYLHGLKLFYLDLQTQQSRLLGEASDYLHYQVGRNGREVVYKGEDTTPEHPRGLTRLVYVNLDRMEERRLAESAGSIDYRFSRETGSLVYVNRDRKIDYPFAYSYTMILVDLDRFAEKPLLEGNGGAEMSLSPDGRRLAVIEVEWDGDLRTASKVSLADLITGQVTLLFETGDPVFGSVYWEDDDRLALSADDAGWIYHISTGELREE